MIKNVGTVDKAVRLVLGVLLLVFAFFGDVSLAGAILAILGGAALIYSGYKQHCMCYKMLGVDTCNCTFEKCGMDAMMKNAPKKEVKKASKKKAKKKKK
jgi:hypothetical protein